MISVKGWFNVEDGVARLLVRMRVLHRILWASGEPQKCSQERISDEKRGELAYKNRNVPEKPEEHHSNSAQE